MRLPTLFYLLIASCVSVFLACGASDELRDSSDELPDDFILSDDVAQIARLPYTVGIFAQNFSEPAPEIWRTNQKLNPAAKADWVIKDLLIKRDRELRLRLELRYHSPTPSTPDGIPLTFVGAALFLELIGTYVDQTPVTYGFSTLFIMLFSPISINPRDVQRTIVTYKGRFALPSDNIDVALPDGTIIERYFLGELAVTFAWLRVYQIPQGEHFYELILSGESNLDFKVGTSYEKVSGSFEYIYLPFPESQMGVAYIYGGFGGYTDTHFFDYVAWVQENVLFPKESKLQPNFPNP